MDSNKESEEKGRGRSWEGINRTEEEKWREIENEVESEIRRARERKEWKLNLEQN